MTTVISLVEFLENSYKDCIEKESYDIKRFIKRFPDDSEIHFIISRDSVFTNTALVSKVDYYANKGKIATSSRVLAFARTLRDLRGAYYFEIENQINQLKNYLDRHGQFYQSSWFDKEIGKLKRFLDAD